MAIDDDIRLRVALKAVAQAMTVARQVQAGREEMSRITKDDRSPVTVADFAVQAIIARQLHEELGEALIAGEEHTRDLRRPENAAMLEALLAAVRGHELSSREDVFAAIDSCNHDATAPAYWAVDPIDGTKGFVRGQQYAIALAYIEHGRLTLGVIGAPNLSMDQSQPLDEADPRGVIYFAAAGFGAWELPGDDHLGDPNRLQLLPRTENEPVRVCESVEKSHSSQTDSQRLLELLGETYDEPVRVDSQCKYVLVARGQADVYVRFPTKKDYREKIWDHAAGALIAAEAGATVSDIAGRPLDFTHGCALENNRGIICAHRQLYPRILAGIEQMGVAGAAPASGGRDARG